MEKEKGVTQTRQLTAVAMAVDDEVLEDEFEAGSI
jgi:hypothetical protein